MRLGGKRVLVTGSSGFVGKHLVRRLREKGARVTEFDITRGRDVLKWEDFGRVRATDLVYHLASKTFVPKSLDDPRSTYELNIQGTNNILEFCRRREARLIFASSYVYGNPRYLPIDENHPLNPTNPYARSKVIAEELCNSYHDGFGVPCVILRFFNIFGEGQGADFLIPEIVNQIKKSNVVTLKDLTPRRDWLYISDAVEAHVKSGLFDKSGFEVFNIGHGRSYSVREIARKLIDLSGKQVHLRSLHMRRKGEIRDTIAATRKARQLLKWKPVVDIERGLKLTLKSYI